MAAPLFGDEIFLRGGGKLTGQIANETGETITIDIGAGTMSVPKSTVTKVDRGTSPLEEYRSRAATIAANDVEGWRKLAQWATQQGLSAQAQEAYSRVHTALPDDAEANRALGLVLHQGKWVPEEESYAARGLVKFEGDWMTVAERESIVRERDARAEANRQAVGALVKESEAERKKKEAEEERREAEEKRRHELPTLGDYNWGYGYVPVWQ